MERLGAEFHRETLKQDLVRMARGDHDMPLLSARKRATTSLTDLLHLATGKPDIRPGAAWRLRPD
jgi:hypothetical protein